MKKPKPKPGMKKATEQFVAYQKKGANAPTKGRKSGRKK